MMLKAVAVFLLGTSVWAQSQYAAKVTMNSGSSFVVKELNIQGDRLKQDAGTASVSLSMVQSIEFRFSGIGLGTCESMFHRGDRVALESLLEQYVAPLAQYSNLPTNLNDYFVWWLKCQYWNGKTTDAGKTVGYIRQSGQQEYIDVASMYFAMMLLDQGKVENANTVFISIGNPEAISVPMTEYINGKFALATGDLRQAMQHVAKIVAFHTRDEEWLPPATVLEAEIYQQLGQPIKAAAVADELIIAYPNSRWSKQGEKIKMESTGSRGG